MPHNVLVAGGLVTHHRTNEALKKKSEAWGILFIFYVMEVYNKRAWLNKSGSPSLGSVVAFDGDVEYSEGNERTVFLSVSDCRFTVKIIKNTESIEAYVDKLELLKSEIGLFINHLNKNKNENKNI